MSRSGGAASVFAAFGPADLVTLVRAVLSAGVAMLAVAAVDGHGYPVPLVILAGVALALDGVDGWVARRTGTASPRGARFDMEVDAALILALSVAASPVVGTWVLAIGSARYVLVVATAFCPWLAAPIPERRWRKVVAAVQGIVLTIVVGGVLTPPGDEIVAVSAFGLLVASFATQTGWLYRHRPMSLPRRVENRPVGAMAAR